MARDYIASLPSSLFPTMTDLADEFALASPAERFELLIATINGFTIDETGVDDDGPDPGGILASNADDLQQVADMARDYIASLPAALFPNMTTLADEFALSDPDERFELLLDIFVDGLSRRVGQP